MEKPKIKVAIVEGKSERDIDFIDDIKRVIEEEGGEIEMFYYPKDIIDFIKKEKGKIDVVIAPVAAYFGGEISSAKLGGEQLHIKLQELETPPNLLTFGDIEENSIRKNTGPEFKDSNYCEYKVVLNYKSDSNNGCMEVIKKIISEKAA